MNIIGKIIGIIAFVFIILMVMNYKTLLPFFDNLILGGGSKSPFQIGTSYVEQIQAIYPYKQYGDFNGAYATTYGNYTQAQSGSTKKGKITMQKSGNSLFLTTEYVAVPSQNSKAHIWLTNIPTVTDNTRYIDFGVIRGNGIQTYSVELKDSNLSLEEYKHVMIIDIEKYTIYGQSVLGK